MHVMPDVVESSRTNEIIKSSEMMHPKKETDTFMSEYDKVLREIKKNR